jgi:hypothetical protein
MAIDPDLIDTVRRFDAQIRRLQEYGIEMQSPGWVARLHARKEPWPPCMPKVVRQEVDRIGILPRLINAYMQGSAEDRQQLRELQKECSRFGGGAGGPQDGATEAPGDRRGIAPSFHNPLDERRR